LLVSSLNSLAQHWFHQFQVQNLNEMTEIDNVDISSVLSIDSTALSRGDKLDATTDISNISIDTEKAGSSVKQRSDIFRDEHLISGDEALVFFATSEAREYLWTVMAEQTQ